MEEFKNWINEFTDKPVFLIFFSAIVVLLIVSVVLSKTSIGKKALTFLTDKAEKVDEEVKNIKTDVLDFKEKITTCVDNCETKLNNIEKASIERIMTIGCQYESFKNYTFDLLSKIPNLKVQKGLEELKLKTEENENYIKAILGDQYECFKHLFELPNNEGEQADLEPIVEESEDVEQDKDSN